MTREHIYFLNGPPSSGKDTAGEMLAEITGGRVAKFAGPLKQATHVLYAALSGALTHENLDQLLQHDAWEREKEVPMPLLFGRTPREVYIAVSELLCKPTHGIDFFGKVLLRNIRDWQAANPGKPMIVCVTDSGFGHEAGPIVKHFGTENCTLIRLHRPDCTFEGDSRGYIELPGVNTIDIHNTSTLVELKLMLRRIAR